MIDFYSARELIAKRACGPQAVSTIRLNEALGRVLGRDASSDMDLPPFDKATMDGFAVSSADLRALPFVLEVTVNIPAGSTPGAVIGEGQAAAIMTGAPVPEGADAVVQVENTSGFGGERVEIRSFAEPGANVSRQGEIVSAGQVILQTGTRIGPEEIGLLASAGCDPLVVFDRPTAALLTTGDEVVAASEAPGPGKIRDSNGPMIAAFLRQLGIEPMHLGRVSDEPGALREAIERGLACDFLITTGGVSAGEFDIVADVLEAAGVEILLQRVAVKPGKPTVFGLKGKTMVFGLPGNPVSALVIAQTLVRPALEKRLGLAADRPATIKARLAAPIAKKPDRLWLIHAKLSFQQDGPAVLPVSSRGSSDVCSAVNGNCLIVAPAGQTAIEAGTWVDVFAWERSF